MPVPTVATALAAAVAAVGGSERPGQQRMAEAVDAAIRTRRHLLVQAGTGTGKSLAYLVPAVLHAQRSASDKARVVVATATIALQGQVVDRDLPRLADALEPLLSRRPTFAMLKGRRNYVCRNKLEGGMPEEDESASLFDPTSTVGPSSGLAREVLRLRDWAGGTASGDRDEVVPGVSERAWVQLSVSARECLGAAKCPYGSTCYAELARDAAGAADVVVTNHALLAIDALEGYQVLPAHDVVLVDEGHELVDRVTGVATDELTPTAVERAASRARRLAKGAGEAAVADLEEAAQAFADALAALPEGRLREVPESLRTPLVLVRDAARRAGSALGRGGGESDGGARQVARAALEAVHGPAERVVAGNSFDVVWVSEEARRGRVLKVAPLVVSGLLRDRLFGDRTVVLTSATLAVGGSFEPVARAVGLGPAVVSASSEAPSSEAPAAEAPAGQAPTSEVTSQSAGEDASAVVPAGPGAAAAADTVALPEWDGMDAGSPFDYPRQGILYVARHLPPPGREGTAPEALEELAELVEAAGGRTLGLFSSMRAAQAAGEAMRARLKVPVLIQGEDATAELVRRFAADAPTCLFGTLSLWQGVDVPGSALQLVVIDRIPFPRPDDPLMSARQQAVSGAGGNGFMAVAAAHAALRLAQGAGRLIRSVEDRGVVAVLDPRLATARYGAFLRASLPRFYATTDPAQVRRSLAALAAGAPDPLPVRESLVARMVPSSAGAPAPA